MIDRGKVIKGLECWTDPNPCITTVDCMLKNCPYAGNDHCDLEIFNGALELLKEQEARVLTQEEVKAFDGYCWYEQDDEKIMIVSLIKDGRLYVFGEPPFDVAGLNWEQYGKGWRCWSAQPTDEQRKAVTWDG